MHTLPIVLLLATAAMAVGVPRSAIAQEITLGPPLPRADATLTVRGEIMPPQAVDGTDAAGRPVFVPAERGAFFLSVDVRGVRGNKNGFAPNAFIPYLTVTYEVRPKAGGEPVRGQLHALLGSRGLRYGNNVPAAAAGPHALLVTVEPPIKVGFGRHTDMETGVGRWWAPFQVEWTVDATRVSRR